MTKHDFRKHIIISSLLTAAAIAIIIAFCIVMFHKYRPPSEENTYVSSGTVADIYYASGLDQVIMEMSNGDELLLVYPWSLRNLYASIGYDLTELNELLKDQHIEYCRMDTMPWVVEIYFGDIAIHNQKLISEQITATRIGIVILGLIMLVFPACGETVYIKTKYKSYTKAKRKRIHSLKRTPKNI